MSASSSNKKIKDMSVDRLSELPDPILCYILSFLEVKEAAITCLLSKRWKFLWTQLPALRFAEKYRSNMKKIRKFVNRVDRTLAMWSKHNLETFEVDFTCISAEKFPSDVNVWTKFAVEKKVKNFSLLLYGYHVLPQIMYSNPYWTSLTLRGCTMAPGGTIQWQSLTTLRIEEVKLNANKIEKLFSGCPVLSSLNLGYCWGFNRLEVDSPSLRRLEINDGESGGELQISAPYIHVLKIYVLYRSVLLEDIESLVRAEINVDEVGWDATNCLNKTMKQLSGSIQHVKMLLLGRGSNKFSSLIALDWRLPTQSIGGCNLEIHVFYGKKSIPGILGVLESSPNLETLVIHFHEYSYQDNVRAYGASKRDLNCDLFHLKTLEFKNYGNPNLDTGKPMVKLARILLKRAIVLEKMVVNYS